MPRHGDGIYKRGRTWWLDFRHDGKRHVHRLGATKTKTAAREIAQTIRARVLKGEHGIGRKQKDITFARASELFLEWSKDTRKTSSYTMHRLCLKKLGGTFGGKRLSQITSFAVEGYKKKRGKETVVRCNRELQH